MLGIEPLEVQHVPDVGGSANIVASAAKSAILAAVAAAGELKSPPMSHGMPNCVASPQACLMAAACCPWVPPHGP